MITVQTQLGIDFEYDERTVRLAKEVAIVILPYLSPGTKADLATLLAERVVKMAEKRYKDAWEPPDLIRCHTCDAETTVKDRVRVVVCLKCASTGSTPGSRG